MLLMIFQWLIYQQKVCKVSNESKLLNRNSISKMIKSKLLRMFFSNDVK